MLKENNDILEYEEQEGTKIRNNQWKNQARLGKKAFRERSKQEKKKEKKADEQCVSAYKEKKMLS